MKKYLAVIWRYSQNSMKVSLEHKGSAAVFMIGKFLRFGMSALFIYFLLLKTKFLAGYSLPETMLIYVTYNIIDSLTQLFFREVYRFRPLVVSGDFDTVLVKPVHPFTRVLLGGFDILDVLPTILYFVFAGYLISIIPDINPLSILVYIGLVINGMVIATAFHILVLSLGILSSEVDHTIMIYRDITRMAAFPMEIYSEPLRTIFMFVIPIGIMVSNPVKSLLGLLTPSMVALSFGLALVFFLFALQVWNMALAKYQSASS